MRQCTVCSVRAPSWGFLLPLQDGLPPVNLRRERTEVLGDGRGVLSVDEPSCSSFSFFSLFASYFFPDTSRAIFAVRRAEDSHGSIACQSDGVRLNGIVLPRDRESPLNHGDCIHLDEGHPRYVFVHRQYSESFKGNLHVLNTYIVGHELGRGTFGAVYILFDRKMNYQRKVMKIVIPKNEPGLKYVKREGEILMSLKHPCVVETFSVTQVGVQCFIVMEYMAGGDLSQFVNDNRLLTEDQTKIIFCQLALAVQYLHEKNICHRDLKPENILLREPKPITLIKVTDFGLSKDERMYSTLKSYAGSRHYLAPEILEEDKYTNAVDVWSLGVILFYSLSGSLPFSNMHRAILENLPVNYDPDVWGEVSSDAQELVRSMLHFTAKRRPPVFGLLKSPWLTDSVMREEVFRLTGLNMQRGKYISFPFL